MSEKGQLLIRQSNSFVRRYIVLALVALVAFLVVLAHSPVPTDAATSMPGIVGGLAYAGYLKIPAGSSVASVGPLFSASLGCNVTPQTDTASASSLRLGIFATGGSLVDEIVTGRTSSSASSKASSTVRNVNVLSGLIKADVVKAVASSSATPTSASSSNGSTFTNLVVNGRTFSGTPAPNTRVDLPGLGYVILNEQTGPVNRKNATKITVNGIVVNVTLDNTLGLPAGTQLILGHTSSSFKRTSVPHLVGGQAHGLFASGLAGEGSGQNGPWAKINLPCTGGSNTVSLGQATIAGVGTVSTMHNTVSGQITALGSSVTNEATTQSVNLLGGLVRADGLTATANANWQGSGSATASTTLENASVGGIEIAANPAPNTRVNLPNNLGYVIVNQQSQRVTSTSARSVVNALVINITSSNSLGLPVGTRIVVDHATASVTRY